MSALKNGKERTPSRARTVSQWHLARLWEGFRWPDGAVERTFTIITTNANAIVRDLHDRMPVILETPNWPAWLDEADDDPTGCSNLLAIMS